MSTITRNPGPGIGVAAGARVIFKNSGLDALDNSLARANSWKCGEFSLLRTSAN